MARSRIAQLVAGLFIMAGGCVGGGGDSPGFRWSQRASFSIPRTDHALVSDGQRLYAIGGFSGSTLASVEAFDPATNTWSRRADLLNARREFAAGWANGKLYVACGMRYTDYNAVTYVKPTEEYDPATDRWTARAPCPIDNPGNSVYGNVALTGAAVNGRLYLIARNAYTSGGAATYAYDPVADRWETKAAPPFTNEWNLSAAELNGSLYLAASTPAGGNTLHETRLAQYLPASDAWIIRAKLSGVWWPTLLSANGTLYALGGTAPTGKYNMTATAAVSAYDAAADAWTAHGKLTGARHSVAAATVGPDVYVGGGSTASDNLAPVATFESASPTPL